MPTLAHLNVFLLISYNMFLGMAWLYLHRTKVDCYDKSIEFMDDNGEHIVLKCKKKVTSTKIVTAMKEKRSHRKGCVSFTVHISSDRGKEDEDAEVLRRYSIL